MPEPPSRLPREHWTLLLLGLALAALSLLVDQRLTDWLTARATRDVIGPPLDFVMSAGGLVVVLAILNSYPNRKRLWVGFLAPLLFSTALVHLLKWLAGRARPDDHVGALHFEPLTADTSFPSAHTSGAVTAALLLGIYFPKARWVFYFFAACTAFKRILDSWHYLSDVFAGAVLGAFCVYLSLRLLGPRYYQKGLPRPAN